MNTIQKFITRIAGISASLLLLFSLTPAAHAQFSGTNGRIMWSGESNAYTILSNNTYLVNTGFTTIDPATYRGYWQAIYTPSGEYMVFIKQATAGAKGNLYVTNAARTITPVAITTMTDCDVHDPASNSDGTKIAFSCYNSVSNTEEIYVINLAISGTSITSSGQIKLTNQINAVNSYNPVWAPDNSVIYIANGQKILSIDPATANQTTGGGTVNSIYTVAGTSYPQLYDVSPNGNTLLYATIPDTESNQQLYTVGVNGTGNTRIVNTPTAEYYGGYYSPDGNNIATVLYGTETQQLQILTSTGTFVSSLNYGSEIPEAQRPFWSTDTNTYAPTPSPTPSPSPTPGTPNTASAVIAKLKSNPLALSFAIAGLLSLVSVGAYWLRTELKSKK